MLSKTINKVLNEVTSAKDGNSVGYYVPPFQPGIYEFEGNDLKPFVNSVSDYVSPQLAHDSYDGKIHTKKGSVSKIESKAKKGSKYVENNYDFITIGESEWVDVDKIPLNEDLGVWFGTKKKPNGSKQPKGPWVNICRKVDGKHPPCGRPDTDKGAYPKCRAAGVAGKMSDTEKKAACQQKRKAEKKDTQTGKGQKPIMTSYKPKNEDTMSKTIKLTERDLMRLVKRVIEEQDTTKQYDYMFNGGDSFNEPNPANKLYLMKNGNTYDVYAQEPNSMRISFTNFTLPLESELATKFNGEKLINNDSANLGNQIAKLITSGLKMSQGNWVIYTKNNGVPAMGRYTLSAESPIDVLENEGKTRRKLKLNQEYTSNDYFVTNKKDKFGRTLSFDEVKDASVSDV
jgi:hypothetical protein